jgi:hypothetical protein
MGTISNMEIEAWQKQAGIEPATGKRLEALQAAQQACLDLIKVLELEISGIRDGDGWWHGGCPVDVAAIKVALNHWNASWKPQTKSVAADGLSPRKR